ncbi:hypothetical protein ACIQWA_27565 [Kitasatospora sp. NPDC098652]|uniref:hypothetical protein n=1 Tax=Kitasatospora sp. NPDC098652 TaxID=3364095 RepID=UPI0037F93474
MTDLRPGTPREPRQPQSGGGWWTVLVTLLWAAVCLVAVVWTAFASEAPPWHGYYGLLWAVGLPWSGPVLGAVLTRRALRRGSPGRWHWAVREAVVATGAVVGLAVVAAGAAVLSALSALGQSAAG